MKFVKSKQPSIIAMHKGNPSYEIEFGKEPIKLSDEIADHLVKNPTFKVLTEETVKKLQKPEIKELDIDYQKELEAIKGIGKKTAKDIMIVFKSKTALIDAVKRNDPLSFQDDVSRLLKQKYGGD